MSTHHKAKDKDDDKTPAERETEQKRINYEAILDLVVFGSRKLTEAGVPPEAASLMAFDLLKEAEQCQPYPKPSANLADGSVAPEAAKG